MTNCPQCGARIDAAPAPAAYVHTCHYCGARIPIEPLAPPPVPAAPQPMRIEIVAPGGMTPYGAPQIEAAAASAARGLGCIIAGAVILPILIPLAIFLGPALKGVYSSHFSSFPVVVGLNETLELEGCKGTLDDTMVTVGVNGKLTLRHCQLKGAMIVKAGVNAEITIIDSTLTGSKGIIDADAPNVILTIENSTLTSAEQIVDEGAENIKVTVSKGSKLHADGIGIPASNNAEISIDHSTLEGKIGGIDIKNNGKVKLTGGAVVRSDGVAIHLENNGHLQITSSRVEGKSKAVQADHNLEGTLRSATLVGPRASMDVGANAHVTSIQSTFTGPKIVPSYSSIDER